MAKKTSKKPSEIAAKKEEVILTVAQNELILRCREYLEGSGDTETALKWLSDTVVTMGVEIIEGKKQAAFAAEERKANLLLEIEACAKAGDLVGLKKKMVELNEITDTIPSSPSPSSPASAIQEEWQRFYKEVFNREENLSNIRVPTDPGGFGWVIYNLPNLPLSLLFAKCRERFDNEFWSYTDDPDTDIPKHDRDPNKIGAYAIRCRDRVEADEENKNLSAKQLAKKKILGLTLPERIILELFYHWKTGKHLDIQNWTLCSGSRNSDGGIPSAYWSGGEFRVCYYGPGGADDDLRARSAVV